MWLPRLCALRAALCVITCKALYLSAPLLARARPAGVCALVALSLCRGRQGRNRGRWRAAHARASSERPVEARGAPWTRGPP